GQGPAGAVAVAATTVWWRDPCRQRSSRRVATEVNLPQWGMGMTEGMITQWLKNEGDPVTEDEEIAEVETEKVTSMLIAPATGTLSKILVPVGETVPVFTTLALIEPGG